MTTSYNDSCYQATVLDAYMTNIKPIFNPDSFFKKATLPTVHSLLPPLRKDVSNTSHNRNMTDNMQVDFQTQTEYCIQVDDDGGYKFVLVSQPTNKQICIIDWLTFSIHKTTFLDNYIGHKTVDHQRICLERMYLVLDGVFGFTIGQKRNSGRNFYENTYQILKDDLDVGDISIGGNKDTILVSLSGSALTVAKYGFQKGIYDFLKSSVRPKITRLDLAYDDFEGDHINVDMMNDLETDRKFDTFGRPAQLQLLGDWKYNDRNGLGRTFQLGSRRSDKMLRCYEKGKQLGDKNSKWTRLEVELKAKHTIIPLDSILKPSNYFINLYPCFADIFFSAPAVHSDSKIKYLSVSAKILFNRYMENFKRNCGKAIRFFREYYRDDELLLNNIQSDKFLIPKRLQLFSVLRVVADS